jgi:hypothetical protein
MNKTPSIPSGCYRHYKGNEYTVVGTAHGQKKTFMKNSFWLPLLIIAYLITPPLMRQRNL